LVFCGLETPSLRWSRALLPEIQHASFAEDHRNPLVTIGIHQARGKKRFSQRTAQGRPLGRCRKRPQPIQQLDLISCAGALSLEDELMATNTTVDWRELFDVALFEPGRARLRQRIEHAKQAINRRLGVLMNEQSENGRAFSERIALSDALTTLAELHRIVYARKVNAGRENRSAADGVQQQETGWR
jgi:hypothetical protein